ncbi:MAG: aspartate--tRNA(Asn) ligase [Chloroflexi bacterium]|nr:aspartate--tRNA(Asn) ligase [Chloroflexota bacterium]
MQYIRTTELAQHVGARVTLHGWLHQLRALGKINFVLLRDGYGIAQAMTQDAQLLAPVRDLQNESVIEMEGNVVAEPQAPGGFELHDIAIRVVTPVTADFLVPLYHPTINASLDTILDHATVALRHPHRRALLRLSAGILRAFREFLNDEGFTEIQSPKLVASATESGANVFAVEYFGSTAYLAQSPQFYKQIMVGVLERVYEIAPVFRAEPHDTTRHVNEYVSLDAEFGFIENHFTVMAMLNRLMRHIIARLAEWHATELPMTNIQLPAVPESIPHIHFRDAQELILQLHGQDCRGEPDLAPQHERWLGAWARATHGSDFLFVTGYPMIKRPFYTHPDPENPTYSNSFDLLFRGTELVTGGQRLHRYADYLAALERAHLPIEPFRYYLEPMQFGMPPHGGFAVGLERFVMQLAGLSNIREATLFPRDTKRLTP